MGKIKILYVITKALWGGAQRYVYDLATSLPKERFDVAVLVGGSGELVEHLNAKGVRIAKLPLTNRFDPFGDIKTFFRLWKIFKSERPDIVHLNSSKIGLLGGAAGRFTGVHKIIFTAHGWPHNEDRPWIVKKTFSFLSWITILLQHHVICVSEAVKRNVLLWPLVAKKLHVIHNGLQSFPILPRQEARKHLEKKISRTYTNNNLVWVGTIAELTKNKGLIYLIQAVDELRNEPAIFFIIGEGKLRNFLQDQIQERKLSEKVFLLGHIPDAGRLLGAFDIFVLPSLTEAFAYTLIEAVMAGLPVVAARVGGIPEIVAEGKTGLLVPSRNPKALAESLRKLITDKNARDELVRGAQSKQNQFSFEEMLSRTEALYTS